jgi:hypothetical protein
VLNLRPRTGSSRRTLVGLIPARIAQCRTSC